MCHIKELKEYILNKLMISTTDVDHPCIVDIDKSIVRVVKSERSGVGK